MSQNTGKNACVRNHRCTAWSKGVDTTFIGRLHKEFKHTHTSSFDWKKISNIF